jgi:hypothetical protein
LADWRVHVRRADQLSNPTRGHYGCRELQGADRRRQIVVVIEDTQRIAPAGHASNNTHQRWILP